MRDDAEALKFQFSSRFTYHVFVYLFPTFNHENYCTSTYLQMRYNFFTGHALSSSAVPAPFSPSPPFA
jgi:hypothetical protein